MAVDIKFGKVYHITPSYDLLDLITRDKVPAGVTAYYLALCYNVGPDGKPNRNWVIMLNEHGRVTWRHISWFKDDAEPYLISLSSKEPQNLFPVPGPERT